METIRELLETIRLRENQSTPSDLLAPIMLPTTPHIVEQLLAYITCLRLCKGLCATCFEPKLPFG